MWTIFSTLLLVVSTLVQCADRQKRQGLIVPPKGSHTTNGTNALYHPAGKPAAPTALPGGITIPSGPLYSPGKVVTKPAAPSITNQHQVPSEAKQPHQQQQSQQQQQKPQHHQQLQQHPINQSPGILDILNALFGTTGTSTHNPLGVNFQQLPPNADVNIKVIQPIYSRPRQPGYIIGSRPVPVQAVQPYSSYQALSYYGSYPRRQDTAGNDRDDDTISI